jgi:hypothetical protein
MLRDRLRQWGMNDKNRRSTANSRRRALQPANNRSNHQKFGSCHTPIYCSSPQQITPNHGNLQNVLHTPKEMLVVQRTLKGILDWQHHLDDSMVDPNHSLDNTRIFGNLVNDMAICLYVSLVNPFSCGKITPQLRTMSAKLQSCIGVMCTPPAILRSIGVLSTFMRHRNVNQWYHETSRFLVNTAVEAFPDSHPSLLLLHLLFSDPTLPQLAMVYEVGSSIMQRLYGETEAFSFCIGMHFVVSRMGLDATFRSFAELLYASTHVSNDAMRLFNIARLHYSMGWYERCSEAAQRCLAQLEAQNNPHDSGIILTLKVLAESQQLQQDFAGQETSLQRILKIVLARDRRKLRDSQLSLKALDAISRLDDFFASREMHEQRDALRLEYPSAFEL